MGNRTGLIGAMAFLPLLFLHEGTFVCISSLHVCIFNSIFLASCYRDKDGSGGGLGGGGGGGGGDDCDDRDDPR